MKWRCGARTSRSRLVKLARPPPEMRIFSAMRSVWSTSSTFRPRWPARLAQKRPAAPAPMTTTSKEFNASRSGAEARRRHARRGQAAQHVADHDHRGARHFRTRDVRAQLGEGGDDVALLRQAGVLDD